MFIIKSFQVWVTHLKEEDIEVSLRQSLKLLQLDYVDLLLSHMPACFDVSVLLMLVAILRKSTLNVAKCLCLSNFWVCSTK